MVKKEEIKKYLLGEDEVIYRTENYYSKTRVLDGGFEITYIGTGKYSGWEPRRIYVPFCDVSCIMEKDGLIVIESSLGEYELRKAYTVEEMKNPSLEVPEMSFSEMFDI